jgi:ABC-2 type transport system permease protein
VTVAGPAPWWRTTLALAAVELRLATRRAESLLVTIAIPTAVLVFFAGAGFLPASAGRPVDFLLPGSLALAVIATGLVSLGIATGYDRSYGVLKRLGGAPVARSSVVAAKLLAVLAVEAVQAALLVGVAASLLEWRPASVSPGLVVAACLLGSLAFPGLGLLMAGTLRAEATLAGANGLFLLFLMLGGIVLPVDHLAAPLDAIASVLPAAALSDLLRIGLGAAGEPGPALALLGAWGLGAAGLAGRFFRWE